MAKPMTCHGCIYAYWDRGLWLRTLWSGFPARPTCANQPEAPGRMKECPHGRICRNYRPRPPTPTGENVKMIPLTHGFYTYVDAADFEWLNQWHWFAYGEGYVARREKGKIIYMHRQIMQPPKGMVVDHINGNGFDNTRTNMRNITRRQNSYNTAKRIGSVSIYKGVSYDRGTQKWNAEIHLGKERFFLGAFRTEAEAARAYDRKAVELFKELARLNFPEEWPPERRAEVYAQCQAAVKREGKKARTKEGKNHRGRKGQGKTKVRKQEGKEEQKGRGPRAAAGKKPRTGKRRKRTTRTRSAKSTRG